MSKLVLKLHPNPFSMALYWLALYFVVSACFIGSSIQLDDDDDGRIVGGEPADIKDLPYQLSVRESYSGSHFCGASIIGSFWALSAAHCFKGGARNVILVSGSSLRSGGGHKHRIEKVISHPLYNHDGDYDIAVLKVIEPFNVGSPGVNCIRLATKNVLPGSRALTSGWGYTSEGGVPSDQLRKVYVPIISRRKCYTLFGGSITENMMCAGYDQGGKDACQGDSGGPLVAENQLIGIVSWGTGCAQPGLPGVYTDVNKLRNWVLSITGNLNC